MTTVAVTASTAVESLPTATKRAHALGLPNMLFGFTPEQKGYWAEPGLPWLIPGMEMPIGYNGIKIFVCTALVDSHSMAPRFPKHCLVNVTPVVERKNLVVGRVYLYAYINSETGEEDCQLGRLAHIGGNYLKATFDNDPTPALWLLRDEEHKAVWDVYEVTHYVSYPAEEELEGPTGE